MDTRLVNEKIHYLSFLNFLIVHDHSHTLFRQLTKGLSFASRQELTEKLRSKNMTVTSTAMIFPDFLEKTSKTITKKIRLEQNYQPMRNLFFCTVTT